MVDATSSALLDTPAAPEAEAQRQTMIARLLRVIALCWAGYVGCLWLLDTTLIRLRPGHEPLPVLYYALHVGAALTVFGMVCFRRVQRQLGEAFLLTMAVCVAALPHLVTPLTAPSVAGPILGTQGVLAMRFAPVTLIGVLLVAWHYPWSYALRLNLIIPLLIIAPAFFHPSTAPTTIAVTVVQTIGFVTFSRCVSTLMGRLRQQHAALVSANRQLRQYAVTLESLAISRERNRVARELHDTLAHTLSSLVVQLEATKAYWEADRQAARKLLDNALTVTRSGLRETRRALDALRASPLDDVGLRLALCDLLETTAKTGALQLDLVVPDQLPPLDAKTEQAIYRIVQEAVSNAAHHAESRSLSLRVVCSEGQIVVRVRDDGRGFDKRGVRQHGHFGLAGMAERAALIGGRLTIRSALGAGTLVELAITLDKGGSDACADL